MISQENKIVTQLLATVYRDKQDGTVIRINLDNAVNILTGHGYNLPRQVFEAKLEQLVSKKMVGAKIDQSTNFAVVQLMLKLADTLHIDERDIMKYVTEHNSEEDVKEIQDKIKAWRKEYYGSMQKSEKDALLNALHDKLRPDVLDQINRA